MFERVTNTTTLQLLQKGLDVSSKRQSVISNNIANVNTPGYRDNLLLLKKKWQSHRRSFQTCADFAATLGISL